MAEMTAAEAIASLKVHGTYGDHYNNIDSKEARLIATFIQQQAATIEAQAREIELATEAVKIVWAEKEGLKCCGNCENYDLSHNGMHIEPQCKLTTYYLNPWQNCDRWQVKERQ